MTLFKFLLIIHIVAGGTGLVTGTIATVVKKGGKLHLASGKFFYYAMLLTSLSALIISNLPNHTSSFLFAVGGFTLYMVITGYRIVYLKKQLKTKAFPFTYVDYLITLGGILFSGSLIFIGYKMIVLNKNNFGIVPLVFATICLNFAWLDSKMLLQKVTVKQAWLPNHIFRMIGALIASYTAFFVVNLTFIKPAYIVWLMPTVVGFFMLGYFRKKYVKK
jgi:uncharacterized membrane protein